MMCEMCGSDEKLVRADIEGVVLNVCGKCAKFGKVVGKVMDMPKQKIYKKAEKPVDKELVQVLSEDYAGRVSAARQRMGWTQKEFARIIKEKESLVQKIESNQFEPSINLARKLENHLRIKIVEQHEESHQKKFKAEKTKLTIGDMIESSNL